jgi:hypothetical protein
MVVVPYHHTAGLGFGSRMKDGMMDSHLFHKNHHQRAGFDDGLDLREDMMPLEDAGTSMM